MNDAPEPAILSDPGYMALSELDDVYQPKPSAPVWLQEAGRPAAPWHRQLQPCAPWQKPEPGEKPCSLALCMTHLVDPVAADGETCPGTPCRHCASLHAAEVSA